MQSRLIRNFRNRLKYLGYTGISIVRDKDSDFYLVSACGAIDRFVDREYRLSDMYVSFRSDGVPFLQGIGVEP